VTRGLTQAALAERIGVGQPAISMMLSRKCRPQRHTIEKLAAALQMAPSRALAAQRPLRTGGLALQGRLAAGSQPAGRLALPGIATSRIIAASTA